MALVFTNSFHGQQWIFSFLYCINFYFFFLLLLCYIRLFNQATNQKSSELNSLSLNKRFNFVKYINVFVRLFMGCLFQFHTTTKIAAATMTMPENIRMHANENENAFNCSQFNSVQFCWVACVWLGLLNIFFAVVFVFVCSFFRLSALFFKHFSLGWCF